MEVQMGNPSPVKVLEERTSPTVFYCSVAPILTYVVAESGAEMRIGRDASGKSHVREIKSAAALAEAVAGHIGRSVDGITHLPDQEALLAVIAAWRAESASGNAAVGVVRQRGLRGAARSVLQRSSRSSRQRRGHALLRRRCAWSPPPRCRS
jgi:hypothetical protein